VSSLFLMSGSPAAARRVGSMSSWERPAPGTCVLDREFVAGAHDVAGNR